MKNKITWQAEPTRGIGPIQLGMGIDAVQQILGTPEDVFVEEDTTIQVYLQEQVYVFFDEGEKVVDIEITAFQSDNLQILFNGLDVFAHNADDLVKQIEADTGYYYDPEDPSNPYSFTFSGLGLTFYRPVIPVDYEANEEDDEHGKGLFFQTLTLSTVSFGETD